MCREIELTAAARKGEAKTWRVLEKEH